MWESRPSLPGASLNTRPDVPPRGNVDNTATTDRQHLTTQQSLCRSITVHLVCASWVLPGRGPASNCAGEPQVRDASREMAEMRWTATRSQAVSVCPGGDGKAVAWTLSRTLAEKSLAGLGNSRSLTPMAPHDRPQPHYPERPHAILDAAFVEAVARRVVELMRGEGVSSSSSSSSRGLVDAATLAAELGVTRSWVYEHRAELGAIQLGAGAKPRLRFDVQSAREALIGGSQRPQADVANSTEAKRPPVRRRGRPRSADSLPQPGGVLAVRPRRATRPPGAAP